MDMRPFIMDAPNGINALLSSLPIVMLEFFCFVSWYSSGKYNIFKVGYRAPVANHGRRGVLRQHFQGRSPSPCSKSIMDGVTLKRASPRRTSTWAHQPPVERERARTVIYKKRSHFQCCVQKKKQQWNANTHRLGGLFARQLTGICRLELLFFFFFHDDTHRQKNLSKKEAYIFGNTYYYYYYCW